MKRIVAIILAITALLAFPSFTRNKRDDYGEAKTTEKKSEVQAISLNDTRESTNKTQVLYEDSGEVYSKERVNCPDINVRFVEAVKSKEYLVLRGIADDGKSHVYNMAMATQELKEVDLPQDTEIVRTFPLADGGFGLLNISEAGEYGLMLYTNEIWASQQLPWLDEYENNVITQLYAVENGFIVFTASNVLALNKQGEIVKNYGDYYRHGVCVPLSDGKTAVVVDKLTVPGSTVPETVVSILDSEFNITESYESDRKIDEYYASTDESGRLLCQISSTICLFDYKNDSAQAIINTSLSGMVPNSLIQIDDQVFFSLSQGVPYFWRLSKDGSARTITIATYNLDSTLSNYINIYNESNGQYKIDIKDYSVYNTAEAPDQGLTQLRTDIITGHTPDIYDLSQLPAELYAHRGVLENLLPYFSNDSAVRYDQLVQSAADVLQFENGLYYIAPEFEILTLCGDESVVGKRSSWTPDDFFEAIKNTPPQDVFGPETTKDVFITYLLQFMEDEYIDKNTFSCNFEVESFKDFLRFISSLPDTCDYSTLDSQPIARAYVGKQPLLFRQIGVSAISFLSFTDTIFSGEAQYVGFPTTKSTGVAISPISLIGISANSTCKSGAIDFVYFLLSERIQRSVKRFPMVQEILNEHLEQWQSQYLEQPPILYTFCDGVSLEIEGKTDVASAKNRILEMIDAISCTTLYDASIANIIFKECQPYFAGISTVDNAASIIQSKVRIYLAEQYG